MIDEMMPWAQDLWPINRSLTGEGVRATLSYIKQQVPNLRIHSVPTGYKAFDWDVPREWNVRDAYIAKLDGQRVVDFKNNNLHLVGYSVPINAEMSRGELDEHLYSLPEMPQAIPYVTSYYRERWGFCVSQTEREMLTDERYRVVVDASLEDGVLDYADVVIPGETDQEVLLSTYICHPSMANNELSGPVVTMALARWLSTLPRRRYTYRIVFVPETIGAIVYLSKNLPQMKAKTIAGFVVTCVGDERAWSFLPSRKGQTLADRAARAVLADRNYQEYSFLKRGSDERQYCAPTVDLPVASVMRSMYGTYPEYHTSLDNLDLISERGLQQSLKTLQSCITLIENNRCWKLQVHGEPQLGKRGLYPTSSTKAGPGQEVLDRSNFLGYCDGETDLIKISELLDMPISKCLEYADLFASHKLLA